MLTWIISTAQQARPKVIHHRLPVRAQVNRSSAVVTMKPFSLSDWRSSSSLAWSTLPGTRPASRASSSSVGIGSCRGSSITPIRARPSSTHRQGRGELGEEDHHRRPAGPAGEVEAHRPGKQERGFEVEDDEQDRDQIEADVELGAGILERREAAFIFAELGRVGPVGAGEARDDHRQHDEARGQAECDDQKQEDRQIAGGDACQGTLQGSKLGAALGQRVAPRNRPGDWI